MNIIGDLKSLRLFWTNLATNQRYSRWINERDCKTFNDRLDHEGLSFLTVVLPRIGKALDRYFALAEWVAPDGFVTKPWHHSPSCESDDKIIAITGVTELNIPLFMEYAIKAAINGNSQAVDCVRQLSYAFYKLEVDFDEETVDSFLDQFEKTDLELGQAINCEDDKVLQLIADMKLIIARVLGNSDPRDIRPCHGSGATACRTENWDKWHKLRYYKKLDDFFPYSDYFFFSPTHLSDEYDKLENSQESIPRARVCLVPKDSRGPRIISCEPAELMYIQQGLMRLLYRTIETHYLTAGQINFTDQSINRDLARLASINDEKCTIDLKDASDRVSLQLIRMVFPPVWVEALEACRSEETLLTNGKVVKLNKFAPMGSSCCFPVEALVFWACARAAIRRRYPRSRDEVYVYGDDIITESYLYETVIIGLERIGLKVNVDKSYVKGPFRESCGGDYHKGYEVTPIRIREIFSNLGTGLSTCADLCNNLVHKFGYEDALPLIRIIEEEVGYVYPRSELSYPNSIRTASRASNDVFFVRRWNKNLQRYEHRILTLSSKALAKRAPSWGELLRKELSRDRETAGEYQHWSAKTDAGLEPGSYTDVHSVRNKWTWTWLG
jgi:hypothetical protein